MKSSHQHAFFNIILLIFINAGVCEYRRVCYYTNWSQYRPGHGRFTPENIPLAHCSHLIYSFADMDGNRLKAYEWNDESSYGMKGMFERFNNLKKKQPGLKTLLAVGGWNFGTTKMSNMLKTKQTQEEFITSTIDFLRARQFDGIDLDFEYPGARGSGPEDKWRFAYLVRDMRKAFDQESAATGRPSLLLTAAVPAGKSYVDGGYDVPLIMQYVDWVSIMTYDFHGKWESRTGHNSPLYPREDEQGSARNLNMEFASNYWAQNGAPRHKLNVGLPLYGRSFTLSDASKSGINAPAVDGGGKAGKYTREKGYLSYYEVCEFLNQGAERFWLEEQKVPYAVQGDQWVGYDDEKSLSIKVDWVRSQGFGGVMVWALDLDDFTGTCGTGKWPLMTTIANKLGPLGSQTGNNYVTDHRTSISTEIYQPKSSGRTSRPSPAESSPRAAAGGGEPAGGGGARAAGGGGARAAGGGFHLQAAEGWILPPPQTLPHLLPVPLGEGYKAELPPGDGVQHQPECLRLPWTCPVPVFLWLQQAAALQQGGQGQYQNDDPYQAHASPGRGPSGETGFLILSYTPGEPAGFPPGHPAPLSPGPSPGPAPGLTPGNAVVPPRQPAPGPL